MSKDHKPINTQNLTKKIFVSSRFGSHFTWMWRPKERSSTIGVLGFDRDQPLDILFSFEDGAGAKYCLPFGAPPKGYTCLDNVEVTEGVSTLNVHFRAKSFEGDLQIINPFTPVQTLDDTSNLYLQQVPCFIVGIQLSRANDPVTFFAGLKAIPFDEAKETALSWWKYDKPTKGLSFSNSYQYDEGLSLIALSINNTILTKVEGYHGLKSTLQRNQAQYFGLAGITQNGLLKDFASGRSLHSWIHNRFPTWSSIEIYTRKNIDLILSKTQAFEDLLSKSKLDFQQAHLCALSFRMDCANSFLVRTESGQPEFYLSEGRFRHMSTIDVSMEAEWLALFNPWRLKLQLDQWAKKVTFNSVQVPSGREGRKVFSNTEGLTAAEFGPLIFHDLGNVPNIYRAEGYDFGPFMPVEQNTSFILLLYHYFKSTGDSTFVRTKLSLAYALAESINNRDSNGNGLADEGAGWSTFDVSNALKDSKDNVYLGVKTWAAYKALADLLAQNSKGPTAYKSVKEIDIDGNTQKATERALAAFAPSSNKYLLNKQKTNLNEWSDRIESNLMQYYKVNQSFPLSLGDTTSASKMKTTALADGLYFTSLHQLGNGAFSSALLDYSLESSVALKEDYGIRLEASSPVTWFSKIIALDGIAKLNKQSVNKAYQYAYSWNLDNDQAYQDGAESKTVAWPGNWYPRAANCWQYWLFNLTKKPSTYLYSDILKACE